MIFYQINFPIYGLIILLSLLFGMTYIYISLKKENFQDKNIFLYFFMFIVFAIVFGKIFTVCTNPEKRNIFLAPLSSYGGVIGVVIASIVFEYILPSDKKIVKYSIISLPLIYSLSKIACLVSGCCYGIPYDGFLSVKYPDLIDISVFPIQLVETITFFLVFLILHKLRNKKNIIYMVIILCSLTKFSLDFLRYDHIAKTITINQVFSIVLIIITILWQKLIANKNN